MKNTFCKASKVLGALLFARFRGRPPKYAVKNRVVFGSLLTRQAKKGIIKKRTSETGEEF